MGQCLCLVTDEVSGRKIRSSPLRTFQYCTNMPFKVSVETLYQNLLRPKPQFNHVTAIICNTSYEKRERLCSIGRETGAKFIFQLQKVGVLSMRCNSISELI